MSEAFELLVDDFDDDHSWPAFIDAARSARKDFAEYRRLGKEALRLTREFLPLPTNWQFWSVTSERRGYACQHSYAALGQGRSVGITVWLTELRELKIKRMIELMFDQHNNANNEVQLDVWKILRQLSNACASYCPISWIPQSNV